MFFTPKENKASKIITAFCSIQDNTIEIGKSLIGVFNAPLKALAISTAPFESLHWPKSKYLGIPVPSISPKSMSLNLNLPQDEVMITQSFGKDDVNSL